MWCGSGVVIKTKVVTISARDDREGGFVRLGSSSGAALRHLGKGGRIQATGYMITRILAIRVVGGGSEGLATGNGVIGVNVVRGANSAW